MSNVEKMIEHLFAVAQPASDAYSKFNKEQVEKIVHAVIDAAAEKAEFYAEWAVRETGLGSVPAKTAKNLATSAGLRDIYDIAEFVEPKIDHEKKVIKIPKPAGVVLAPMPCTNPILTTNFKVIANLVARNAVILSPHPAAKECSIHAGRYLAEVAEKAGAPKGTVQILEEPSIDVVNMMMKDPRTALIMATGGPALVHAAYSSGNPAVGVGPANVGVYVDETANVARAGANVVMGNSFDNGLPCTCESIVLAERSIAAELKQAVAAGGGWFAEGEDNKKLRDYLFIDGVNNPKALGKSAYWIGQQAGVAVPEDTLSILMEIDQIGDDEPVSKEKMFPVLGFFVMEGGVDVAIDYVMTMLNMIGKGHSAGIHTERPEVVAKYTTALPVCRIAVNTPAMLGSGGLSSNLIPSGSIGTGFFGGSSVSENVTPKHLIQYTSVAYDRDESVQMGDVDKAFGV